MRKRIRDHPSNVSNNCCSATASASKSIAGRRQQMDDVEIVVRGRKGVDERKALKLLSKFLKRDQVKDADDQVGDVHVVDGCATGDAFTLSASATFP